jgi:hypothetical protein
VLVDAPTEELVEEVDVDVAELRAQLRRA